MAVEGASSVIDFQREPVKGSPTTPGCANGVSDNCGRKAALRAVAGGDARATKARNPGDKARSLHRRAGFQRLPE